MRVEACLYFSMEFYPNARLLPFSSSAWERMRSRNVSGVPAGTLSFKLIFPPIAETETLRSMTTGRSSGAWFASERVRRLDRSTRGFNVPEFIECTANEFPCHGCPESIGAKETAISSVITDIVLRMLQQKRMVPKFTAEK